MPRTSWAVLPLNSLLEKDGIDMVDFWVEHQLSKLTISESHVAKVDVEDCPL